MRTSATIKDISRETSFSTTTVSRVLNGLSKKYRISQQTESLIIEVARRHEYRPNLTAVNLRLKKSNTIGLIVPSLSNPFFSNISSIINRELRNHGFSVILTDCEENEQTEAEVTGLLVDRRIDGLVVIPSARTSGHLESVHRRGIPIVFIDRYFTGSDIPYVSANNFLGAYELTKHLIDCGHERIACIQGVHHTMPNVQRVRGYVEAMRDAGLDDIQVSGKNFEEQNGYIETRHLMQKAKPPTAIFTLSDTLALGSLRALREIGSAIPDDVSLVTFDNADYLDYLNPPLTSVVQPVAEIAELSIKILLDLIGGGVPVESHNQQILLKPNIIHRSSVRIGHGRSR